MLTAINPKVHSGKALNDQTVKQSLKVSKKVSFDESKNEEFVYDVGFREDAKAGPNPSEEFKKGEKVMYRNHLKEIVRWIPAVVVDRIGSFLYKIKFEENGNIRNVHRNQLRRPSSFATQNLTKIPVRIPETVQVSRRHSESDFESPVKQEVEPKIRRSNSFVEPTVFRRSGRERRSPDRFRFEDY